MLKILMVLLFFYVNIFATQSVKIYSYDEGLSSANMSKPRIKITNTGDEPISNFKVYYYFSTENQKRPIVENFYTPNCNVYLESVDNVNSYRVVYAYTEILSPGQTFPNESGNVVGLRYSDWSSWSDSNDYSNNGESVFTENNKILVENSNGQIIYGIDPVNSANSTQSTIPEDTTGIIILNCPQDTTLIDEDGDGYEFFDATRTNFLLGETAWWYEEGVGIISIPKLDGFRLPFEVGFHKFIYYINTDAYGWLKKTVTINILPKNPAQKNLSVYAKEEAPYENNIVKPRIYVKNNGSEAINGYYYYYYFNPESTPVVEDWYTPDANVTLESINDTLARIKYDCTNKNLAPLSVSPNLSGNSLGLHYSNWSNFDNSNDFSYPGNSGNFVSTKNIPVFDAQGNLIYGNDPLLGYTQDTSSHPMQYISDDMLAQNKWLKETYGFDFPEVIDTVGLDSITFTFHSPMLIGHKVGVYISYDRFLSWGPTKDLGTFTKADNVVKFPTFYFLIAPNRGTLYYCQLNIDEEDERDLTHYFYMFVLPPKK